MQDEKKIIVVFSLFAILASLFSVHIFAGILGLSVFVFFFAKYPEKTILILSKLMTDGGKMKTKKDILLTKLSAQKFSDLGVAMSFSLARKGSVPTATVEAKRLSKRKKYLHIALNSTLEEAGEIIFQLPISDRILIEAGTPLIKTYGIRAISEIQSLSPAGTYIVADNKCADLADREVDMMANAGANAATCLGVAPIETIEKFIESCERRGIDSILDCMNVESPLSLLKRLKRIPTVVMVHRGVDETEFSKEKQIPYYQIQQIKGNYDVLVAVAGGDTAREVQRAFFNGADIVVVWKNFYEASSETARLAKSFLREVR